MRTGVCSTAWTRITGRSRRRLRKKEKKKIDKVRFFYSPRTRDATRVLSDASTRCPCARLECAHLERSRLDPSPAAGARHDRVPQVPRVELQQLGQGRLSGEAQARSGRRGTHRPNSAHRARGVAARPSLLSRRRGALSAPRPAGPLSLRYGPFGAVRGRPFF